MKSNGPSIVAAKGFRLVCRAYWQSRPTLRYITRHAQSTFEQDHAAQSCSPFWSKQTNVISLSSQQIWSDLSVPNQARAARALSCPSW